MKQKDILIIVILLFIFTLISIGYNIYSNTVTSTIPEDVSQDILPISPTFDTKAIDKLKFRESVVPSYDLNSVNPTPVALPSPLPSINASQGGKLIP
jgi:hypothetical protein